MSISKLKFLPLENIEKINIPNDVSIDVNENYILKIKGPKGEIILDFSPIKLNISKNKYQIFKNNKEIVIKVLIKGKRGIQFINTLVSKIKNCIKGVKDGYVYKLKIVYSHFPINIQVLKDKVLIKNFMGEKNIRIAKIIGKYTKVEIKKDDVIVSGINKDEVSQTAANIQQATKIKNKDPRKFLDGIYIYYRGK